MEDSYVLGDWYISAKVQLGICGGQKDVLGVFSEIN